MEKVMVKRKATPKKVDLLNDKQDFILSVMASLGFSNNMIQEETNYTPSQVSYRTRYAEIKLADYRNGQTKLSKELLRLFLSGKLILQKDDGTMSNRTFDVRKQVTNDLRIKGLLTGPNHLQSNSGRKLNKIA